MNRRAVGTGNRFLRRQPAPGSEHTPKARVECGLVRDVHATVLRPDHVEASGRIGEIERVAEVELHMFGQSHEFREHRASFKVVRSQVDNRDDTGELSGERARRSAETAADIQDSRARLRRQEPGEAEGCFPSASMKLIERRKVGDRQLVDGSA